MNKISKLGLFLVLFGLINSSHQQIWKNNKIVWGNAPDGIPQQFSPEGPGSGTLIGSNMQLPQQFFPQQQQQQQFQQQFFPPQQQQASQQFFQQQQFFPQQQVPQQFFQQQQQQQQPQQPQQAQPDESGKNVFVQGGNWNPQQVHPVAPVPSPAAVPAQPPAAVVPASVSASGPAAPGKPYAVQESTQTSGGETVVENLIAGINFDCAGKATGHYRDGNYCDVFHACVFGQQRKSYSCPFVGEPQYFDDVSRKCEFVKSNPTGCGSNVFFH